MPEVFTVKVLAPVNIGVFALSLVPYISPELDCKLTVVPDIVPADCDIVPVPLALIVVVEPPPVLAESTIAPLLVVCNVTVPPELTVTAPDSVRFPLDVILTVVFPPPTVPVFAVPKAVTVRVFVPRVIVCPLAE